MNLRATRRRRAVIDIVPLVDVLVVLIFFFLVTMQFRNLNVLDLTLPEVETAGESEAVERVDIAIDVNGDIFLNGEAITLDALPARLGLIAQASPGVPVVIAAHEESYLREVTEIMDACRQAGLRDLRLQSR